MKLLILFCLITSYCLSEEISMTTTDFHQEVQPEYKTYQIIEIEEQKIKDEREAVALNKKEIQDGRYWVDGRWIQRKNSNYIRIAGGWFYCEK